jgi:hypothetical protein
MNKIPVGQTIRFAYAFTFGEIGTIIGLIWIPTLINAVATFFALRAYYSTLADSFESGMPPAGASLGLPILLAFLAMLLVSMIAVAITQQAMGLRQGPAFAHIALGSAEWRTFGGFFGLYLLFVLFIVVFAIVVSVAAVASAAVTQANPKLAAATAAVVGAASLAGVFVIAYMVVRLSFLLVPSVVDGGEFGLTRSWQLTKGNFWRIVAIALATLLPIFLVFVIVETIILGPGFFIPNFKHAGDTAAALRNMVSQMRAMQDNMPLLMGLSFVVSPLLYGLMFSASAFAYRFVSGSHAQVAPKAS